MAPMLVWRFVSTVSKEGPDVYRMVSISVEKQMIVPVATRHSRPVLPVILALIVRVTYQFANNVKQNTYISLS